MAKRYIPRSSFTMPDKKGRKRTFVKDRIGRDGTVGYSEEEVANLTKTQLKSFDVQEVEGETVVERATAAPGEKRSVKKPKGDSEEE